MRIRVIGLDIGGSKTHAVLSDGHSVLAEAVVGSANLASVGEAAAAAQLAAAFAQLLDTADSGPVDAVCAGAAGAGTPSEHDRLAGLIRRWVPRARVRVVHDTRLLLAAAGLDHGVALISGTGSVAWATVPDGRWVQAGGWGYLLGDEGSGYALAVASVRHVLGRIDQGVGSDPLTDALLASCGLAEPGELLDHFYAHPERRYWAARSGLVFELAAAGDPVGRGLVTTSAGALAELVRTVCTRLDTTGPVLCAGGQLVYQRLLVEELSRQLAGDGITDLRVLDRDPVHGAINLALATVSTTRSSDGGPE